LTEAPSALATPDELTKREYKEVLMKSPLPAANLANLNHIRVPRPVSADEASQGLTGRAHCLEGAKEVDQAVCVRAYLDCFTKRAQSS
jgi:hypothetical protein